MKKDRIAKGSFLLAALSLLLPWFSFAPDIMGYCHGTMFALHLALPMIALACCLFSGATGAWVRPLAIFSAGAALALMLLIPGWWMTEGIQPGACTRCPLRAKNSARLCLQSAQQRPGKLPFPGALLLPIYLISSLRLAGTVSTFLGSVRVSTPSV